MDTESRQRIKDVVLGILTEANMEETTEYKVRTAAAEKLGLDLSLPDRKLFVRKVVEDFLVSKKNEEEEEGENNQQQQKQEEVGGEEVEEEEEEEKGKKKQKKEYDDEGDLIICRLSNKRRVTIQDFKGRTLVSIREYYDKDGKQMPSSKGISLTAEQWQTFSKAVPKIEDAIRKLEED
ncbi:RNA polymerase II transcriptional coactivator KELP [Iris pallida]|uniref:RNA polymerase II transcriptional coactivator KELP n=1 Tax=Iris pallida TaxID=29817 RepID=A0AAX6GIB6_IRIPA|nr:RNA polymerase II transcriptional coactivator KELP [Iris pallida]